MLLTDSPTILCTCFNLLENLVTAPLYTLLYTHTDTLPHPRLNKQCPMCLQSANKQIEHCFVDSRQPHYPVHVLQPPGEPSDPPHLTLLCPPPPTHSAPCVFSQKQIEHFLFCRLQTTPLSCARVTTSWRTSSLVWRTSPSSN